MLISVRGSGGGGGVWEGCRGLICIKLCRKTTGPLAAVSGGGAYCAAAGPGALLTPRRGSSSPPSSSLVSGRAPRRAAGLF